MAATVYFAKWILLPDGEILVNGGVAVEGARISTVGPRGKLRRTSKDRIVNLGETLLMPGLVNMHTHLEEGVLRGLHKQEEESFAVWMTRRRRAVRKAPPDTVLSTVRLGIREALANGITTVVDTSQTDISPIVLRDEPIRSWVIHETHPDSTADDDVIGTLAKRIERSRHEGTVGAGPYALFSLTPSRHRALVDFARRNGYLWACHVAESSEELQAFSEQTGDLYGLITRKSPWPFGPPGRGSMYYAVTGNLIPNQGLCYHCNYMSGQELSLLTAKNVTLVFCPQYNDALGHKPFPLDVALGRGCNVCLGTESPESSAPMNLFDELNLVMKMYPHIPSRQLVRLVTTNAARALRCGAIGALAPGCAADLIGLRFPHDPRNDILDELILEEPRVVLVVVDGEEVIVGY
ncbi:MAG: amidohydrolase family protein [Chitinivibrionales bacterium]|nr:amidohydrolase family protein [Chitinivibrionales bacterium]MBD3395108.1 amidohydrolase family protein [Chitinivibrionales bacterium]